MKQNKTRPKETKKKKKTEKKKKKEAEKKGKETEDGQTPKQGASGTRPQANIQEPQTPVIRTRDNRYNRNLQQLTQLEEEEKRAVNQLGERILIIEGIVKEAKNIHKPIRDAINEAVIIFEQMQDYREALQKLRAAQIRDLESVNSNAHTGIVPTKEKQTPDRRGAAPRIEAVPYRTKVVGKTGTFPNVIDVESGKKKRGATSPPQIQTPGKKDAM